MKYSLLWLLPAAALALAACTPSASSVPSSAATAETPLSTPAPDPTEPPDATPAPTPQPTPVPEETVKQRYIETFSAPDLDIDTTVTANGCTLTLEDSLDTEPELLVYSSFVDRVNGDLDQLGTLLGEDLSFVGAMETEAAEFQRGQGGMATQTIHELHTMTWQEVEGASDYTRAQLQQYLADYDLQQWTMVAVDLDWTYTPEKEAAGPQLPAGRYQRYFLLGSPSGSSDLKLYNLYWEDFYPQT